MGKNIPPQFKMKYEETITSGPLAPLFPPNPFWTGSILSELSSFNIIFGGNTGSRRDGGGPYSLRRRRQGGKFPHRDGRTRGIKTTSTNRPISLLVVDRRREYGPPASRRLPYPIRSFHLYHQIRREYGEPPGRRRSIFPPTETTRRERTT